jgi:hypothetical protein
MKRGYSLEQDLRLLINNPKYSDIEILCEDEKKLYGSRAILAARSEVFDRLLYNGMKESYENQISFPKIYSSGMEIILEYIYTGSIKFESLTKDNTVEAFYAADYFQLPDLQDSIMKTLKNTLKKNYTENYSPELLSKAVDTMPLLEDNILLNLLVESVAMISLNTIEFGRLSKPALQFLLSYTHEKEKPFVTPEYEVFRYSAILAAKQVSNDAYEIILEQLPTLKQLENSLHIENKFITERQKIVKELEPLIKFIDFSHIKGQILADIIDPLEIIPSKIILNVYRQIARNSIGSNKIRGTQFNYVWDETACGSKLIIENDGKIVRAPNGCGDQSIRAKIALENKLNNGIFEWDVIIEKACSSIVIGVCTSEYFNYEYRASGQSNVWALGGSGKCISYTYSRTNYCPSFRNDGTKITVHLDMNNRTCAFTINSTKYPVVSEWNLPSKLYPIVSLRSNGIFRIQPH